MDPQALQRLRARLDRLIESCRDEMAQQLAELLMFSTVSGAYSLDEKRLFINERSRAFTFLSRQARRMGFEWRNYDNRVGVIEQPGGSEVLGVPVHIDVVPSGDGWHYPAFGGMIEDGVIYGRGAQDNKGPLIQFLYALRCLKHMGLPFRRTVRLIIPTQEETGDWSDVKTYLEREPAPDLSIVPDAEFPIVNGEKGMIDLDIELKWKEPLSNQSALAFQSLEGGERPNVVPNRAEIVWTVHDMQASGTADTLRDYLAEFMRATPGVDAFPIRIDKDPETGRRRVHVIFSGKSAHSSVPEEGHNALIDALRFIPGVPERPGPLAELAEFLVSACEDVSGSGLGIDAEHDFLGPSTASLDMLRIDATGARAVVNVRSTYGTTSNGILQKVRSRAQAWGVGHDVEVEVRFRGDPYEPLYVDPEKSPELIGALQDAFTHVTGAEATLISKGGTTFAKAFPNALSFGPVYAAEEEMLAHQADECVRVEHVVRNARIYGQALLALAIDLESPEAEAGRGQGLGL